MKFLYDIIKKIFELVIVMNKIRFGIVGPGNIAHRFANAIKNVPDAELTAVASRYIENANKFADEFNIPYRFEGYENMAKSDVIDAVYISVPHSGHAENAILFMNHGKHVLSEKPLAVNAREVTEMIEASVKNNVFLMEGMWARFVPGTLKMLEIANSGILGDLKCAEGKFCYSFDEDEMDHHALKVANGGGSLLDVGCYCLYFSSWYLGNEVERISAEAENFNGVDSHLCALIKYKSGAIADLSSAVLLRKNGGGVLYGTKGYAQLDRCYAPQSIKIVLYDGKEENYSCPYSGNGFEEQIIHTCECINNGLTESPVNTFEQSLFIAKQMDEIRKITDIIYPQDLK